MVSIAEMSDFEYVRQRLPRSAERAELDVIAKGSGVSIHTLIKIVNGETEDPRTSTVNRLVIYFKSKEARRRGEARAV